MNKETRKRLVEAIECYHAKIRNDLSDCIEYVTGDSKKYSGDQNKLRILITKLKNEFEKFDCYVIDSEVNLKKEEFISALQVGYENMILDLRWYKCEHFTKLMDQTFVSYVKDILSSVTYANDTLNRIIKRIKDEEDEKKYKNKKKKDKLKEKELEDLKDKIKETSKNITYDFSNNSDEEDTEKVANNLQEFIGDDGTVCVGEVKDGIVGGYIIPNEDKENENE